MSRKEKLSILNEVGSIIESGKVKKARKLAMRHNLRLTSELRSQFCHKCNSVLKGNSRTRLNKGKLAITCLKCGNTTRTPIKSKKTD
jgi:RNase P subunit RPR2